MAATLPSGSERSQAHCTGRFDYTLPAALVSSGRQMSLYRLDIVAEAWLAGGDAGGLWRKRLASTLSAKGVAASASTRTRAFDLPGVGPAAWLGLFADRPELVTLLAMKPVAPSQESVFLRAEASAGREAVAEKVVSEVAGAYVAGSQQGFCAGAGAFVIKPSKNERALESFNAGGVDVSVQTETVAAPDDGQSTDGAAPAGGRRLLKDRRSVGGFDGIEERVQVPDGTAGSLLSYTWIFAGRAADGAAPRIRLSANGPISRAAALDTAWTALLASWRQRPVGGR